MRFWARVYRRWGGESLGGAVLFYSCFPWPWPVTMVGVARWITLVGCGLAGLLGLMGSALHWLGFNPHLQAGLLVLAWLGLTGGLHLDGVADSADGLAVTDRQKRLTVMQDSYTGAYGVMAIVMVLLLKTLALASFSNPLLQGWALLMALGWGRWGQLLAIALYPYLKAEGKGAMHGANLRPGQDLTLALAILLGVTIFGGLAIGLPWAQLLGGTGLGFLLSWGVGYWFAQRFGGHTGDTYGAVVEWSETFILVCLTLL